MKIINQTSGDLVFTINERVVVNTNSISDELSMRVELIQSIVTLIGCYGTKIKVIFSESDRLQKPNMVVMIPDDSITTNDNLVPLEESAETYDIIDSEGNKYNVIDGNPNAIQLPELPSGANEDFDINGFYTNYKLGFNGLDKTLHWFEDYIIVKETVFGTMTINPFVTYYVVNDNSTLEDIAVDLASKLIKIYMGGKEVTIVTNP